MSVKALARLMQSYNDRVFSYNPNYGRHHRDISFTWDEYREYLRFRHIIKAVFLFAIAMLIHFSVVTAFPLMSHSVISAIAEVLNFLLQLIFQTRYDFTLFTTIVVVVVFLRSGRYIDTLYWKLGELDKGFSQLAMREEVVFRHGSERWTISQKMASCLSFGLAHLETPIVPFTAVVTLTFMGAAFMYVYHRAYQKHRSRRHSLKESAAVHMTYNVIVVSFLGLILVGLVGFLLLSLIF